MPAPAQPPPPVVAVNQVATLPLQKTPISEGTSGLHYSGRLYTNDFAATSKDVCSSGTPVAYTSVGDVYTNGVSTADLSIDSTTGRVASTAVQGYVTSMVGKGLIPGQYGTFDDQAIADTRFYQNVQAEYCFYEARYSAALTQFLNLIADPAGADNASVQTVLNQAVTLNRRLNSLLEVINYVGNDRAQKVNARGPDIDKANQEIQERIATLNQQQGFLQTRDVREQTQAEMMRFSTEKNRAMNIQIMFFVALNVVALGTVLTVYKAAGGGGAGGA